MKSIHKAPVTTCFIFLPCILKFRKVLAELTSTAPAEWTNLEGFLFIEPHLSRSFVLILVHH